MRDLLAEEQERNESLQRELEEIAQRHDNANDNADDNVTDNANDNENDNANDTENDNENDNVNDNVNDNDDKGDADDSDYKVMINIIFIFWYNFSMNIRNLI